MQRTPWKRTKTVRGKKHNLVSTHTTKAKADKAASKSRKTWHKKGSAYKTTVVKANKPREGTKIGSLGFSKKERYAVYERKQGKASINRTKQKKK